MNILITGGLGYIGSRLCDELQHHNITVIDNLYTQRYCSLFNRTFRFIEDDFANLSTQFIKQFDTVIHLAAIVDATKSDEQADLITKVNINDTIEFFKKCEQAGTKAIFPSSTSVYGVSTDVVYEDDDSFLNPQSGYAKAKLYVEKWLKNTDQLDYSILRLGTVSGVSSGMRFQTCINKFCYQASFGMPITVWKENYDMYRPYLSLHTLYTTISWILNHWYDYSKQTFNVLTKNMTPREILGIIKEKIHDVQINETDCPLLNQYSYIVSNKKIKDTGEYVGEEDIYHDICDTLKILGGNNQV